MVTSELLKEAPSITMRRTKPQEKADTLKTYYAKLKGVVPSVRDSEIQKGMKSVKGTLAMEGLDLQSEEEKLIRAKVEGELSEEEFMQKVQDLAYE